MNNAEYNNELRALEKERFLKEEIVNSYKNRIINELLSEENPIIHEVIKTPKKSFWKRLLSAL